MKATDTLFTLIQSLSKPEKGYFKKFSERQPGEKNYVALFDAIENQKEYNEEKILKKFQGEKFTNNFSEAKSYLFELILKSMNAFHARSSYDITLREMLFGADFLFNKGMYNASEKLLKKTKEKAIALNKHYLVFEALLIQRRLDMGRAHNDITEQDLEQRLSEGILALKKIKNEFEFSSLGETLSFYINKQGEVRTEQQQKKFKAIIDHALMADEGKALTIKSQRAYHFIQTYYNLYAQNNLPKAFASAKKTVELIELSQDTIWEEPSNYVNALNNLIILSFRNNKYDVFFDALEKTKKAISDPKIKLPTVIKDNVFLRCCTAELNYYYKQNLFEEGLKAITNIEKEIKDHSHYSEKTSERVLFYNFASFYWITGNNKKALGYINKIVHEKDTQVREDVFVFAKIMQIIIHYEANNDDILPYLVKSFYRFLLKKDRLYEFEKVILNFIRKDVSKIDSTQERIRIFKSLKLKIEALLSNPLEKIALQYIDMPAWLESKINNKPIIEILRQKKN